MTVTPMRLPHTENVPVDLTNADLTEDQKSALQIFSTNIKIYSPYNFSGELGRTNLVQNQTDTGDHPAIRQQVYLVPVAQKEGIEQCIDNILYQGIIRPSNSAWASPVVLIKKPDGSDRFCCNLRNVNSVTKKDSYHLPRIADILYALSGTQ